MSTASIASPAPNALSFDAEVLAAYLAQHNPLVRTPTCKCGTPCWTAAKVLMGQAVRYIGQQGHPVARRHGYDQRAKHWPLFQTPIVFRISRWDYDTAHGRISN